MLKLLDCPAELEVQIPAGTRHRSLIECPTTHDHGFPTDVKQGGVVYHVQSEARSG